MSSAAHAASDENPPPAPQPEPPPAPSAPRGGLSERLPALASLPRRKVLWVLFCEFFKIALFIVGGGYAIIIAADEVFGKKLKWLREGELLDHLPIFQSIPGLIAGNSAIYVGLKAAGITGVLVALFAVALPSFVIITLVAIGYNNLPLDNPYLQGAFLGLRSALSGIIIATLIKSWKRVMHGFYAYFALVVTTALILVWNANVGLVLVGAMLFGIFWKAMFEPAVKRLRGPAEGGRAA